MNVEIVALTQDLSLRDGETHNFLNMLLPDGTIIRALVDPETAQLIVNMHITGQAGSPAPDEQSVEAQVMAESLGRVVPKAPVGAHQMSDQFSPVAVQDDGSVEFGGDGTGQDTEVPDADMAQLQAQLDEAQAQIASAVPGSENMSPQEVTEAVRNIRQQGQNRQMPEPQWRGARKAVVRKTPMGYPVLQGQGFVDPGEVVGSGDDDEEDNVRSV